MEDVKETAVALLACLSTQERLDAMIEAGARATAAERQAGGTDYLATRANEVNRWILEDGDEDDDMADAQPPAAPAPPASPEPSPDHRVHRALPTGRAPPPLPLPAALQVGAATPAAAPAPSWALQGRALDLARSRGLHCVVRDVAAAALARTGRRDLAADADMRVVRVAGEFAALGGCCLVADGETSGLSLRASILEFVVAPLLDRENYFVGYALPDPDVLMRADHIHDLRTEDLERIGAPSQRVMLSNMVAYLAHTVGNQTLFLVAYGKMDYEWLRRGLQKHGVDPGVLLHAIAIDALALARNTVRRADLDQSNLEQGSLYRQATGKLLGMAHCAAPDVDALATVFAWLRGQGGAPSLAALIREHGRYLYSNAERAAIAAAAGTSVGAAAAVAAAAPSTTGGAARGATGPRRGAQRGAHATQLLAGGGFGAPPAGARPSTARRAAPPRRRAAHGATDAAGACQPTAAAPRAIVVAPPGDAAGRRAPPTRAACRSRDDQRPPPAALDFTPRRRAMFEESGSSSEDDDDDDTEETTTLIQRLSTEDVAVIQKARDEGRGVSLAWFLGKAIQHNGRECPVEHPWYASTACEQVARKLARLDESTQVRSLASYEGLRVPGRPHVWAEGFTFNLPRDDGDDNATCARMCWAAYKDFDEQNGYSLTETMPRQLDLADPEQRELLYEFYEKHSSFANRKGRRPFLRKNDVSWDLCVVAAHRHCRDVDVPWLIDWDLRCRRASAKERPPPSNGQCEFCASLERIATRASSVRARLEPADVDPPTFTGESYVVLEAGAAPELLCLPVVGATAGGLVPDHIKGTKCLRCWACVGKCNARRTPVFDTSSNARAVLRRQADATNMRSDYVGQTAV